MKKRIITHQPEVKQVTRFKMYKDGKNWITAGLSRFTFLTKKSDMANQATETKEKGQAQHGLLKGLIGVGALLGGTVMTNSDVFADTPVANEKGAAADNVVDLNTVTIPAASKNSQQTSAMLTDDASSVSNSAKESNNMVSPDVNTTSETPSEQIMSSQASHTDVQSNSEKPNTTSQVESQPTSQINALSTSEKGNQDDTASATASETPANVTIDKAATVVDNAGFSISDPDYPANMPHTNDKNQYDFLWFDVLSGPQNNSKIGSVLVSISRDDTGLLLIQETSNSGEHQSVTMSRGQDNIQSKLFSGLFYHYLGLDGTYSFGMSNIYYNAYPNRFVQKFYAAIPEGNTNPDGNDNTDDFGLFGTYYVPQKVTQTIRHIDGATGKVLGTYQQVGWTGQRYTTNSGEVIKGYFADDVNQNGNGVMSQYGRIGAQYFQNFGGDGYTVTYTQIDAEGTMDTVVTEPTGKITKFTLKAGESHGMEMVGIGNNWMIFTNPYIKQTANIDYVYQPLGYLIVKDSHNTVVSKTQYVNDPNDSSKATYPLNVVPNGYQLEISGQSVSEQDVLAGRAPAELGKDTIVKITPTPATSQSESASQVKSTSESVSQVTSASTSTVGSQKTSTSASQAASTSVSTVNSQKTSTSASTAASQTASTSVSTVNSQKASMSASTIASQAASTSVSVANSQVASQKASTAASQTASTSVSVANSQAASQKASAAASQTASTSVSVANSQVASQKASTAASQTASTNVSVANSQVASQKASTAASQTASTSVSVANSQVASQKASTSASTVNSQKASTNASQTASTSVSVANSQVASQGGSTGASTAASQAASTSVSVANSQVASQKASTASSQAASTSVSVANSQVASQKASTTASQAASTSVSVANSQVASQKASTSASTVNSQKTSTSASTVNSQKASTAASQTASTSVSVANSQVASQGGSTGASTAASQAASTSVSVANSQVASQKASTAASQTASTSISTANSQKASTSASTAASQTASTSVSTVNSQKTSTSASTNASQTASTSVSTVNSQKTSTSASTVNSQKTSTSESIAASTVASQQASTSLSMAASLSHSQNDHSAGQSTAVTSTSSSDSQSIGSQVPNQVKKDGLLPETGEHDTTTALLGLGLLAAPLALKRNKKNKKSRD